MRDDANPTSAASVDFLVTFTESVSGVDTGDFVLATTGTISGVQVASVSGSGAVYTVSVSTGTGDGTVRLDLSDNDSILGSNSQPLGGAGVGNGSFASGESYLIDKTAPTISVTFPSNGGAYNAAGWTDAVTGTAADAGGAGLAAVEVSLRRGTGNYWDGDGFDSETEVFLAAAGTAAWSLAFPDANFSADGSYTVRAQAADLAGNVTTSSDRVFQYDSTSPPAPVVTGITDDTDTAGDGITRDPTLIVYGTAEAGQQRSGLPQRHEHRHHGGQRIGRLELQQHGDRPAAGQLSIHGPSHGPGR